MSHSHPDDPTGVHTQSSHLCPNTTKLTIGQDTYTLSGSSSSGVSVIRRSGRWRAGARHTRRSLSANTRHRPHHSPGPGDGAPGSGDQLHPLPSPDSPAACSEAHNKLQYVIRALREDGLDAEVLLSNLEYIGEVLGVVASKTEVDSCEDDLSELQDQTVPEEVRLWLAETFAKQDKAVKKSEERPTLRSVANAIRTGIFIEKIYRRMFSNSQMMSVPKDVENCLERINDWNFDTFSFSSACKGSPLKFLGYHLLNEYGCTHKYKIPPSTLETLLGHLEIGYHRNGNPYHNNLHASDVLQTTHWLIGQTGIKDWLSDLEIFALLFSAIIHDYDHSGTTNNFHVQSSSNLAILYNDKSVLENHHVAAFFKTMLDNDCFILGNMSQSDFREFRSLMIEMVLHTDMSLHFSQLKHMKNLVQTSGDGGSFDKTRVLSLLLHSADISHPTKQWQLHYQWTARCMEEFFKQGDMEQEQGLDFSPLCDRQNTMVPQAQIGFIDFIVSPTLSVCGEVMAMLVDRDKKQEKPWQENMATNKELWQEKADAGDTGISGPTILPSCPTVLPSCPTILPSCPTILPSCPTILPSCPTILQDQKPPRVVTMSGTMQGPPSKDTQAVSITETLSGLPSSPKKPGVTITETMSDPPSLSNQPGKKRL